LIVIFSMVWPNDPARQLVESGAADPWFWIHVAQAIVFAVLAILTFRHLATMTRAARASEAATPI
jgi:hypothetical protein